MDGDGTCVWYTFHDVNQGHDDNSPNLYLPLSFEW